MRPAETHQQGGMFICSATACLHVLKEGAAAQQIKCVSAGTMSPLQIMVRKETGDASALMLFRKKADVAPVDPLFFPAPPAHTSNEVRSALSTRRQHEQALSS